MTFDPVSALQDLIRLDTTNPPGNEALAINYLVDVLERHGLAHRIVAKDPSRPNLIASIRGAGNAPGLLMQGHVDVVPTAGQPWSKDPFSGDIHDGFIWGRGSLDMKSGIVMMVDALLRLAASDHEPAGDIVFAALADEEAGSEFGAKFLVNEHPDLFDGIRYSVGEFGGFPLTLGGVRFYPIQIAERSSVVFRLTIRGDGGHGSLAARGGTTARLAEVLRRLDRRHCPIHVVPPTKMMLEAMMDHLDGAQRRIIGTLLHPRTAAPTLAALRSKLGVLEPVLRNTVAPTIISSGDKVNVLPATAEVILDGRLLPGLTAKSFAAEVRDLVGEGVEVEFEAEQPTTNDEPDMGLFNTLAGIVKERDPEGVPIPFLLPAVTDGRWFARLGIQHYGFQPMKLPDDFVFQSTVHAADERIPVAAVNHGADAMYDLLTRYEG